MRRENTGFFLSLTGFFPAFNNFPLLKNHNGKAKFRYLDHFNDDVKIYKDVIVPVDGLKLE